MRARMADESRPTPVGLSTAGLTALRTAVFGVITRVAASKVFGADV